MSEYNQASWGARVVTTTMTSREFKQNTGRAKHAARRGPVFITDRGRPAYVFLTIEEYKELASKRKSLLDAIAMPEAAEIDFEPPRLRQQIFRPADFW